MKVDKICHIHFWVKDAREAAKRFSEVLGSKWVGPILWDPLKLRVVFDHYGIELFEPVAPNEPPQARFIPPNGEGFACLGLKVPDIEEAVADLKSKGIRFVEMVPGETILQANESLRAAWTEPEDFFNVMLELLEYEERQPIALANLNRLVNIPSPDTIEGDVSGGESL